MGAEVFFPLISPNQSPTFGQVFFPLIFSNIPYPSAARMKSIIFFPVALMAAMIPSVHANMFINLSSKGCKKFVTPTDTTMETNIMTVLSAFILGCIGTTDVTRVEFSKVGKVENEENKCFSEYTIKAGTPTEADMIKQCAKIASDSNDTKTKVLLTGLDAAIPGEGGFKITSVGDKSAAMHAGVVLISMTAIALGFVNM